MNQLKRIFALSVAVLLLLSAVQVGASATSEEKTIIGDVNTDGSIDNLDATLVLQYAAGWTVEMDTAAADVNGDSNIDNLDATLILQYAAGWDVSFVEPEEDSDGYLTYEEFMALSAQEQLEYIESFEDDAAFFEWYNAAKKEYDEKNSGTELDGGTVDLGDIIGGNG